MRRLLRCALLTLALMPAGHAQAGVTNPDISVIGQPFIRWNDNASDPTAKRPVFDVGETELVFDAALNPYAKGFFDVTLQGGQIDIEEGYFSLLRGLPGDIQLKGGKYRVGFGKLNPAHPHTYPFANRFGVLAAYLPGEGIQRDRAGPVVPAPTAGFDLGDGVRRRARATAFASRARRASVNDPLNQDPVNGDRAVEPRAAWLGRLATFIGVGVSSASNSASPARRAEQRGGCGTLAGHGRRREGQTVDVGQRLLVQGEYLHLERDNADWSPSATAYSVFTTNANGGYLFADYNWKQRYNVGGSFDSYEDPTNREQSVTSVGAFTGLALMEETTAFRLDWRRSKRTGSETIPFVPGASAIGFTAVNEVTLRVIFSMGPHKAHQF
jgi:hypothetical protein